MENKKAPGAQIERGIVTEITEAGRLEIESYDRPGVSCELPKGGAENAAAGDRVCFALFADGTGIVLGILEE